MSASTRHPELSHRTASLVAYVIGRETHAERMFAALFVNAHGRHALKSTYSRGLLCLSCGIAELPGSGPYGGALAPNATPRKFGGDS